MKNVELKISKSSNVVYMNGCPQYSEIECGILYRM